MRTRGQRALIKQPARRRPRPLAVFLKFRWWAQPPTKISSLTTEAHGQRPAGPTGIRGYRQAGFPQDGVHQAVAALEDRCGRIRGTAAIRRRPAPSAPVCPGICEPATQALPLEDSLSHGPVPTFLGVAALENGDQRVSAGHHRAGNILCHDRLAATRFRHKESVLPLYNLA